MSKSFLKLFKKLDGLSGGFINEDGPSITRWGEGEIEGEQRQKPLLK